MSPKKKKFFDERKRERDVVPRKMNLQLFARKLNKKLARSRHQSMSENRYEKKK